MSRPLGKSSARRKQIPAVARAAEVAAKQGGTVSRRQLLRLGFNDTAIHRRCASGYLHRVHAGVYAVGHPAIGLEGRLCAALLYAGDEDVLTTASPTVALSHTTATWRWDLIDTEPRRIHLSTCLDSRLRSSVCIHHPRVFEAVRHRGYPVTPVARTLVDAAAMLPFEQLRHLLARAEFKRLLRADELAGVLRPGRPGARALRRALALHLPELAQTLSPLEARFLILVQRAGLPRPEANARVEGLMVDVLWREAKVIVELDGASAHGSESAVHIDRSRDLRLRSAGFVVNRYSGVQIHREPDAVIADVARTLRPRLHAAAGKNLR